MTCSTNQLAAGAKTSDEPAPPHRQIGLALLRQGYFRLVVAILAAALATIGAALLARHIVLVDLGWSGAQSFNHGDAVRGNRPAAAGPLASENTANKNAANTMAQHPLEAALDFARQVQQNIDENVHDYTATLIKQERIGDQLSEPEICFVKIHNLPLSVYMKFLAPADKAGQEVIFVAGQNDGKLIGHAGSGLAALVGSKWLPTNGPIAMLGQHYPITELGIANLTRRLIEVGQHDLKYGDCNVWRNENAKVGDRPCISITVEHPEKRKEFIFHVARIFVDKQWMVPIHYEAFDWPAKPGDPLPLLESYTYANLKLNPGLTDADFDPTNPDYNFGLK